MFSTTKWLEGGNFDDAVLPHRRRVREQKPRGREQTVEVFPRRIEHRLDVGDAAVRADSQVGDVARAQPACSIFRGTSCTVTVCSPRPALK